MTNIPHILLAAGTSKRMGQPKQLLRWTNKSLIQFQVETILPTTEKIYIILGAYAPLIHPLLKNYKVELINGKKEWVILWHMEFKKFFTQTQK